MSGLTASGRPIPEGARGMKKTVVAAGRWDKVEAVLERHYYKPDCLGAEGALCGGGGPPPVDG